MLADLPGPLVVASVLEPNAELSARRVSAAPAGCALVELRADHLRADEVRGLVRRAGRPLCVTARRAQDGGAFDGTEEERRALLLAALAAGARLIDVEADSELGELGEPARRLRSLHGRACTRGELDSGLAELRAAPAAAHKLVPRAVSAGQVLALRELLAQEAGGDRPLACFALGRAGALSRLLAPAWGSWASYGAAHAAAPTAEGQFDAWELLEVHDVLGIRPWTRLHALIGRAVLDSPSPALHRAGQLACGLDTRYLPLELDDLAELEPLVAGLGLAAFGVTLPFKEQVAARVRLADRVARAGRTVNTVLTTSGGWLGYNTDGPAALALIRAELDPRGARVAIAGAGGTARAVAVALRDAGAAVVLYARAPERAASAAAELGVSTRPLHELAGSSWDVLVNATPVGRGGERLLAAGDLGGRLVLDAVYARSPTPLIEDARARGLVALDGLSLLVAQARRQFRRMTGRSIDTARLRAAGLQWLSGRSS